MLQVIGFSRILGTFLFSSRLPQLLVGVNTLQRFVNINTSTVRDNWLVIQMPHKETI